MTIFILGAIMGLCVWPLLCAGRWLRRRRWPTMGERVSKRFRLLRFQTSPQMAKESRHEHQKAEETSVASRLSTGERRTLHSLGPLLPSSLDTEPPGASPTTRRT
jgi:hypothetical protein